MSARVAAVLAMAVTLALCLSGFALAVALHDGATDTQRRCTTASKYACQNGSRYARP